MIKTKWMYAAILAMLLVIGAAPAWSQTGRVTGHVTSGGKPLADATVVLTNSETGKTYTMKTDKSGQFFAVGVLFGVYEEEVSDSSGQKLFKTKVQTLGTNGLTDDLSVEVAGGKTAGPSKEQLDKMKADREKALGENALITQLNPALQAKNWEAAEPILQQLIVANPNRWEYQQALGNAQLNLNKFDEAIATYEKAIPLAQNSTKTDTKVDPAKVKAGVSQMLSSEGSAYLKLKKNDKAIEAFTKSAEMDPNPGAAYFNICATQYNSGNTQGALAACDKAIAADPNKAEAYFIKGSLMMGDSKQDKDGKLQAPAGTAEALNKYLELEPDGAHAGDVKQMLTYIGAKIETTYKEKKKK